MPRSAKELREVRVCACAGLVSRTKKMMVEWCHRSFPDTGSRLVPAFFLSTLFSALFLSFSFLPFPWCLRRIVPASLPITHYSSFHLHPISSSQYDRLLLLLLIFPFHHDIPLVLLAVSSLCILTVFLSSCHVCFVCSFVLFGFCLSVCVA